MQTRQAKRHRNNVLIMLIPVASILLALAAGVARAGGPAAESVGGKISQVGDVRVLQVWGTPQQRGYAQGFLMGKEMATLVDGFVASGALGGSVEAYEQRILPGLRVMKVDSKYETELRGMLAGIQDQADGPVKLPSLSRALKYEDLLAINCVPDLARMGCSSFAAWGAMTGDGGTIAGRNMDWHDIPALRNTQIIVAHALSEESGGLGWVSITWPGFIGCLTGMNAEGVSVATHDANGRPPSVRQAFTPYAFMNREGIESARASTALQDVERVLKQHVSAVGNNMMVTMPYTNTGSAAAVFEFDGDHSKNKGVTVRMPDGPTPLLICTNHFRERVDPHSCDRYTILDQRLEKVAKRRAAGNDAGVAPVDLTMGWSLLDSVAMRGLVTHHSVIFEPNKGLMHVALSDNGKPAPQCKAVTLDVKKLLTVTE